ncbi:MAG: glutathione S-transferase C-terminal domain-containing protein, partial [Pseudomonadota bacterium]|nr:glutathione S-transferase C-terminal domain-containing protein [Pseudomonadota bacterium]
VYKSGFATTQEAYDEAVGPLFDSLDWIEGILSENRYLAGDTLTEADWRLFTTLVRFDKVYHTHFKCNRKQITEYPHMWAYVRELYQHPAVAETVHFDHITRHYYYSHDMINPNRIVPIGPEPDFLMPHGRG